LEGRARPDAGGKAPIPEDVFSYGAEVFEKPPVGFPEKIRFAKRQG
jgi:hypothetical protein